jgi:hypothetical protein
LAEACDSSALDGGIYVPLVPVADGVPVPLVPAADGAGALGAGLLVLPVLTEGGVLGLLEVLPEVVAAVMLSGVLPEPLLPPLAACSNAFRCVRNSTSFARTAGSTWTPDAAVEGVAPAVVPVVPVAPVDGFVGLLGFDGLLGVVGEVPVVGAGAVVPVVPVADGDGSLPSGPSSAFRFASTLSYAERQFDCVVISSLKFEISCDTCVRASPWSRAAWGIDVIWLSVSRASVRCCLAAAASTVDDGWADGDCALEAVEGLGAVDGDVPADGCALLADDCVPVPAGGVVVALVCDDCDGRLAIVSGLAPVIEPAPCSARFAAPLLAPLMDEASSVM